MRKTNKFHPLKILAAAGYSLGVLCLGIAMVLGVTPASVSFAQSGSGAIWTTNNSCGAPQNVNQYAVGDVVYINGDNFDADEAFAWDITRVSGGMPKPTVALGNDAADGTGAFCFAAYTILSSDAGQTYQATVGDVKSDNFRVDGAEPEATNTPLPTNTAVPPTEPAISCSLPGPTVGQLVNISTGPFIRSDQSEAQAKIGPLGASLPAGTYKITLSTYDNHTTHVGPDQPNERWVLILLDSSGVEVTRSQAIGDLPGADNWLTQVTDSNLVVSRDVVSVVAYHAVYPDTSSPNSLVPVCGSIAAVQVEPTPTNTPIPPTETPVPTDVPPTNTPDPTDPPESTPTNTPDPTDPAPTSVPPTRVPPTDVPPPISTSPAVLIPVTGLDFNLSGGMINGLFNDLGIALLGFGFLMHGAWLHFGKEE